MELKSLFKLDLKSLSGKNKIVFRFEWAAYVLLALVVILNVYVLQSGVRILLETRTNEVGARQIASFRVNFEGYNQALKRIQDADYFVPKNVITTNPFSKPSSGE